MAWNFDESGSDQYFENTSWSAVTDYPISLYCKFRLSSGQTATDAMLGVYQAAHDRHRVMLLVDRVNSPERIICYAEGNIGENFLTDAARSSWTVVDGEWHNVVGVAAGSADRRCWVDGANEGTQTTSVPGSNSYDTIAIGRASDASPSVYFGGDLADMCVWNVALSASDVAPFASNVSPLLVRPDAIVFYWPGIRENVNYFGSGQMTQNGSPTVTQHPATIMPHSRQQRWLSTAAGGIIPAIFNQRGMG